MKRKLGITAIVGRKFVTPIRSTAASLLVSRQLGHLPALVLA